MLVLDFELLELDSELIELDLELLELGSKTLELDFELFELDTALVVLERLLDFELLLEVLVPTELLDAELLEPTNWLLAALVTRLDAALDGCAPALAELVTMDSRLLDIPVDELLTLAIDELVRDESLNCSELANDDPAPILAEELATTAPGLTELATTELAANGLEGELLVPAPPAPPPQDAKKPTVNNNVLIFKCLNDAIYINDRQGCILISPRTRRQSTVALF